MSKWQEYRNWLANESEEAEFWFLNYLTVSEEVEWTCAKKMGNGIWFSSDGLFVRDYGLARIEYNLKRMEGAEISLERTNRALSYYWNLFKKWCGI